MHLWHKQQRTRQVEGSQKPTGSLRPNEPERAGSGAAEALGSRPVARSCLSHRGDEHEGLCWAGNWSLLHKQYCSQRTAVNSQTGGGNRFGTAGGDRDNSYSGRWGGNRTQVVLMHNRARLKRRERSESDRHIPQFNSCE